MKPNFMRLRVYDIYSPLNAPDWKWCDIWKSPDKIKEELKNWEKS